MQKCTLNYFPKFIFSRNVNFSVKTFSKWSKGQVSLWNIWSLIESYYLSLMRIFWVLQKGPTWRIMNSANFSKNSANSNPSSSTARKRCLSASSSSKKLGEVDGCSKRSPRFRNRNILQLNEKYLIWPYRIHTYKKNWIWENISSVVVKKL